MGAEAQVRDYFSKHWQSVLLYAGVFTLISVALTWQLHVLPGSYSNGEVQAYQQSRSMQNLLDNPLNAPFYVLIRLLSYVVPDSYIATRIASMMIGLGTAAVFATAVHAWHNRRTAIISTILFGISAWFLHAARLGTADILYTGIFTLAMAGYWLKSSNSPAALIACFTAAALALYTPGMIWFVLLGVLWQWRTIDRLFKEHLAALTLGALVFIAALAPLGWALFRQPDLIKTVLAIPTDWAAPLTILEDFLQIPYRLVMHNSADPTTWLNNAPVLDAFSAVMLVLGSYIYARLYGLARTRIFLTVFIVTAVLVAIGSIATLTALMPFLYLVIAAGISYVLSGWFAVFPHNPIARSIGWGLVLVIVSLACIYHAAHYFTGWPKAKATAEVFTNSKP